MIHCEVKDKIILECVWYWILHITVEYFRSSSQQGSKNIV